MAFQKPKATLKSTYTNLLTREVSVYENREKSIETDHLKWFTEMNETLTLFLILKVKCETIKASKHSHKTRKNEASLIAWWPNKSVVYWRDLFNPSAQTHKADNLLSSDTYRKWKAARPGEKQVSVILQVCLFCYINMLIFCLLIFLTIYYLK